MTKVLVEDSNLTSIANAIREKNGQTTQYKPSEMGTAIEEIELGLFPTETIEITENGSYNVMNYANANVNVPSKILQPKTITENGVYNAIDDGVDGYDVVTVEIELDTSDATATASDITMGKTAYIAGGKVEGTMPEYFASVVPSLSNNLIVRNIKNVPETIDISKLTSLNSFLKDCNLLEKQPKMNTSHIKNFYYTFANCGELVEALPYDTSIGTKFDGFYSWCRKIVTMPEYDLGKADTILYILDMCEALTNFGGFKDLGKGYLTSRNPNYAYCTLDLVDCVLLTHESLMNVINKLYDIASIGVQPQQLKLGATNLAKLSEEEIAIATNKGWSVVE